MIGENLTKLIENTHIIEFYGWWKIRNCEVGATIHHNGYEEAIDLQNGVKT